MNPVPFLIFSATAMLPLHSASLSPSHLRCDGRESPVGIDSPAPRFSWQLLAADPQARSLVQTAYQIRVSAGNRMLWDSGKVSSDDTNQIAYAGPSLATSQKLLWNVRVWDRPGNPSPWSESGSFTMGVLKPADWNGRWITPSIPATDAKATLIRKEITVAPGLTRAVIHVSGLGQCETRINGRKAAADHLTPGWTKYDKTVLYDSYDITPLLQQGRNTIGLMLGNGMYQIPATNNRYAKWTGSAGPRQAIARILLEYSDGRSQVVGTDSTWKWCDAPVTFNTVYGGEDYDARLEQPGWDRAGFNAESWAATVTSNGPGGTLRGTSHAAPPLRTFETFNPTPALDGSAPSKVYDFGQNTLQLPSFRVFGPPGSAVKLTPSELGDTSGNGNISPIVGPTHITYTLKGSDSGAPECFTPHFFSFGYRYLKVETTGGATLTALTSTTVHTASPASGDFSCSKDLFNRTRQLIRWAQISNLVSVITDCPTREMLGWLEQYHLHGPSLRYEFDLMALYAKCYTDMADSQRPNGLIPDIAPEYVVFSGGFVDSPEWGAAFALSPAQQFQFYNDRSSIETHRADIERYIDYLTSRADGHIIDYGLGDWYDLGPGPLGKAQLTPPALTATATYHAAVKACAAMAGMTGDSAAAANYSALARDIRTAFNRKFYDPASGCYSTGSQTANAMPLALGLVDETEKPKVVASLVADIRRRGNAITTGDIGHRYLLRALADNGRSDVIYDIHSKTDAPGYGRILASGATSLTEGWDGSASQNHFMLGHITEWFYHDVAGIQPDPAAPGFKNIVIKPAVVGDLTWAKAGYHSVRGPVSSHWRRDASRLALDVTVPPGSTATVCLPTLGTPAKDLVIKEGETVIWRNGKAADRAAGVVYKESQSGRPSQCFIVWNVGSGSYRFSSAPAR